MTPPTPEQLKAAIRVTDGVASCGELQIIWALGQQVERAEAIAARVLLAHVRATHQELCVRGDLHDKHRLSYEREGATRAACKHEWAVRSYRTAAALLLPGGAS